MSAADDTKGSLKSESSFGDIMNMAAEIFASAQEAVPSSSSADTSMSDGELGAALSKLLSDNTEKGEKVHNTQKPAEKASGSVNIMAIVSAVMQGLSGDGSLINPEKLNLVKALKPYMTDRHKDSIDRAIKMANMACAAKTALSALGR